MNTNSEEIYTPGNGDALTERIATRLGERQQKLDNMEEWEKSATVGANASERLNNDTPVGANRSKIRPLWVGLAMAACVAALLVFAPWNKQASPLDELGIDVPTTTEFRSAAPEMSEIGRLMDEENFSLAMSKTEEALKSSDLNVEEWIALSEFYDDEEFMYEGEVTLHKNSELRWTYIYLLVKAGRSKDAKREIKTYLLRPDYCEHADEAQKLQKTLK